MNAIFGRRPQRQATSNPTAAVALAPTHVAPVSRGRHSGRSRRQLRPRCRDGTFWPAGRPGDVGGRTSRVYTTSVASARCPLTDGTRVVIAPESRVRLAADLAFNAVTLRRGRSLFRGRSRLHPAVRSSPPIRARWNRTAFAVRSYAEDRAVRVVVTEGRVVMSGAGPLAAGDVGRLTAEGRRRTARVDVPRWSMDAGELAFEDAPLGQVLRGSAAMVPGRGTRVDRGSRRSPSPVAPRRVPARGRAGRGDTRPRGARMAPTRPPQALSIPRRVQGCRMPLTARWIGQNSTSTHSLRRRPVRGGRTVRRRAGAAVTRWDSYFVFLTRWTATDGSATPILRRRLTLTLRRVTVERALREIVTGRTRSFVQRAVVPLSRVVSVS